MLFSAEWRRLSVCGSGSVLRLESLSHNGTPGPYGACDTPWWSPA